MNNKRKKGGGLEGSPTTYAQVSACLLVDNIDFETSINDHILQFRGG
jgi:hypothetical protein